MHAWDVSPKEAITIQKSLLGRVFLEDAFGEINTVAGVDVGFEENNAITRAAIAVLEAMLELFNRNADCPPKRSADHCRRR